jgi:hypothetical protein
MIPGWEKTIKEQRHPVRLPRMIQSSLPCIALQRWRFPELQHIVVAGDAPRRPGFITWEDCLQMGAHPFPMPHWKPWRQR